MRRLPAQAERIFLLSKIQTSSENHNAYEAATLPPVQNSRSLKLQFASIEYPTLGMGKAPTTSVRDAVPYAHARGQHLYLAQKLYRRAHNSISLFGSLTQGLIEPVLMLKSQVVKFARFP